MLYEGAGLAGKRWLDSDERGSITRITDGAGATLAIDSYDEYGVPATGNLGRFGYTGQAWLPEAGVYDYKARMYSPTLGRFMQTDPIGYADGPNWYDYVHGDPVNETDAEGLGDPAPVQGPESIVTGPSCSYATFCQTYSPWQFAGIGTAAPGAASYGGGAAGTTPQNGDAQDGDVVVTGVNCALHPADARCGGVTLIKDNQTPIPCPGGGGPDTGCMQMFNACHTRADSFPNDNDARNAYLECRDALRVCSRIENDPTKDGFIYVRGVGWVFVSGGRSYFLPVPPSWRRP